MGSYSRMNFSSTKRYLALSPNPPPPKSILHFFAQTDNLTTQQSQSIHSIFIINKNNRSLICGRDKVDDSSAQGFLKPRKPKHGTLTVVERWLQIHANKTKAFLLNNRSLVPAMQMLGTCDSGFIVSHYSESYHMSDHMTDVVGTLQQLLKTVVRCRSWRQVLLVGAAVRGPRGTRSSLCAASSFSSFIQRQPMWHG